MYLSHHSPRTEDNGGDEGKECWCVDASICCWKRRVKEKILYDSPHNLWGGVGRIVCPHWTSPGFQFDYYIFGRRGRLLKESTSRALSENDVCSSAASYHLTSLRKKSSLALCHSCSKRTSAGSCYTSASDDVHLRSTPSDLDTYTSYRTSELLSVLCD